MKTYLLSPWGLALCYLTVLNLVAFCTFGWDKHLAKCQKWRVAEKKLFLLCALGGCIGALLAMKLFRHKTRHRSFTWGIPAILVTQLLFVGGLYLYCNSNWK